MDPARLKRVSDLAEMVWARPEAEWASILAPQCAGDAELLSEVTQYVRRCQADPSLSLRLGIDAASLFLKDPSEIGHYQVLRRLGEGGMGVVYKTRLKGEDLGKQPVAVKVIKRGLDTEEFVRRFRAERYVMGQLVHPNIARIVDAGSTDDGRPFFVMEYISGSGQRDSDVDALPLDKYVASRCLGIKDRLRLFQRICSVVEFAHQRDIIHRDQAVNEEVKTWQNRALEPIYGIVYLDALYVKMRHEGRVENRAVYVAIGVDLEGRKEVLGLWTSANEGAKFWLSVLTELKNRGVKDMLIVCVDGLKGFPQAIEAVFPQATVQLCIVHLVRASLKYVSWKERKQVAADLKPIYRAATELEAEMNLDSFITTWGGKYKAIGKLWKENWERVIPFFAFPEEVRKVIYTTNAVEALNRGLRKIIKNRGSFPSEEAALKLLYLALQNISKKWESVQHWRQALNQFEILWGDRIRAAQKG